MQNRRRLVFCSAYVVRKIMVDLAALVDLYDGSQGIEVPLPEELSRLYGSLRFPIQAGKPYVISNFVQTIDGVVTLDVPGHEGGGDISGYNHHDRLVMGILRASADVVLISAGSLRVNPRHTWTAGSIFPELSRIFGELRRQQKKPPNPAHVVVSASGKIDLSLPLFTDYDGPVLVVTTQVGEKYLAPHESLRNTRIASVKPEGYLTAAEIMAVIKREFDPSLILSEAGPHLTSFFLQDNCLDELFLTIAPQVAGRDGLSDRWSLFEGKLFAPDDPHWAELISIKQGESYLFLRYAFGT